jgi:NTP pyrophosphatase (non-canonical NTP hydrolase)
MKSIEYDAFVRRTDQSVKKGAPDRRAIAMYGLIGEIGSLVSAVKKKILAEGGESAWDEPSAEIKEEIGDVLWYCYSLAQVENAEHFDILANDIALLRREIAGENERAEKIRAALEALNPATKDAFLAAAGTFPQAGAASFDEYQKLAFKTARTDGRTLLEVCLAVLPQLGAELLRKTLPEIEQTINRNIADRPINTVLGEITWHLAAIASLYHVSLDGIVDINRTKVSFRMERGTPTRLHDEGCAAQEQFPRTFDVAFVRIGRGKSRMYFEGRRLGNDLTDNAYDDDGYRFHDVLHLALIAHLGWSPVLRGFMKRKRPDVDDVEDGGRAKVVEELVLKAIHSEGERQIKDGGRCSLKGPVKLFAERSTIPFGMLKTIRIWVSGLEVEKNAFWEWEDAICDGSEIFFLLRQHKQGTVHVDLSQRRITFTPTVSPGLAGITVAMGMGAAGEDDKDCATVLSSSELKAAEMRSCGARTLAAKRALAQALSLGPEPPWQEFQIEVLDDNRISVTAGDGVQERIWMLGVVDYKVAFTATAGQTLCTVVALADAGTSD